MAEREYKPAGTMIKVMKAARDAGLRTSVTATGEITVYDPYSGQVVAEDVRTIEEAQVAIREATREVTREEIERIEAKREAVRGMSPAALRSFLEKATPEEVEALKAEAGIEAMSIGTEGTIRIKYAGEVGTELIKPEPKLERIRERLPGYQIFYVPKERKEPLLISRPPKRELTWWERKVEEPLGLRKVTYPIAKKLVKIGLPEKFAEVVTHPATWFAPPYARAIPMPKAYYELPYVKPAKEIARGIAYEELMEHGKKPAKYLGLFGLGLLTAGVTPALEKIRYVKYPLRMAGLATMGVYAIGKVAEVYRAPIPFERGRVLGRTAAELQALGLGAIVGRRIYKWGVTPKVKEVYYRMVGEPEFKIVSKRPAITRIKYRGAEIVGYRVKAPFEYLRLFRRPEKYYLIKGKGVAEILKAPKELPKAIFERELELYKHDPDLWFGGRKDIGLPLRWKRIEVGLGKGITREVIRASPYTRAVSKYEIMMAKIARKPRKPIQIQQMSDIFKRDKKLEVIWKAWIGKKPPYKELTGTELIKLERTKVPTQRELERGLFELAYEPAYKYKGIGKIFRRWEEKLLFAPKPPPQYPKPPIIKKIPLVKPPEITTPLKQQYQVAIQKYKTLMKSYIIPPLRAVGREIIRPYVTPKIPKPLKIVPPLMKITIKPKVTTEVKYVMKRAEKTMELWETKTGQKQREKAKEKTRTGIKTLTEQMQKVKVKEKFMVGVIPKVAVREATKLKYGFRLMPFMVSPRPPRMRIGLVPYVPFVPFIPKLPKALPPLYPKPRKIPKGKSIGYGYTPSIYAREVGIWAKPKMEKLLLKPRRVYEPFVVRPMIRRKKKKGRRLGFLGF